MDSKAEKHLLLDLEGVPGEVPWREQANNDLKARGRVSVQIQVDTSALDRTVLGAKEAATTC